MQSKHFKEIYKQRHKEALNKFIHLIETCESSIGIFSEIEVKFIKEMRTHKNKFDVMSEPQLKYLESLALKAMNSVTNG